MRFHHSLDTVLGTRARLGVLRPLATFPNREFTGREVARLAGLTAPGAIRALEELERTGLVHGRVIGATHLWSLSSEHLLTATVRGLFRQERTHMDALQGALRRGLRGLPLRRAVLFGSVARGEENADSDVDLYLEVASARARRRVLSGATPLVVQVQRRFGNHLSLMVATPGEMARASARNLRKAILTEGIVLLGGEI